MSTKKVVGKPGKVKYVALPKKSIKLYADSVGHPDLSNDVVEVLRDDVNYRIREVLQLGFQMARKCKRKTLLTSDINAVLQNMDVQPIYGHSECLSETKEYVAIDSDLYTEEDDVVQLLDVVGQQVNNQFVDDLEVEESWLPAINLSCGRESEHVQTYMSHIIMCLQDADEEISKSAFTSLKSCKQINELMPCIMAYITFKQASEEPVVINSQILVLKLVEAIISNRYIHLHSNNYLETIMHTIIGCQTMKLNALTQRGQLVGKQTSHAVDDMRVIREKACRIAGVVISLFTHEVNKMRKIYAMKMMRMLDDADDVDVMGSILLSLLYVDVQTLCKLLLPKLQFFLKKIEHIHAFHSFPHKSQHVEKSKDFIYIFSALTLFMELVHNQQIKLTQVLERFKASDDPHSFSMSNRQLEQLTNQLNYFNSHTRQLHSAYSMLQELLGDCVTLRLPLQQFGTNVSQKNELHVKLTDEESTKSGDELLKMFTGERSRSNEEGMDGMKDDSNIKATITDSLHGIKLKISKLPKPQKNVPALHANETNASIYDSSRFASRKIFTGSFDKKTMGVGNKTSLKIDLCDAFELTTLKIRENVLIPFRFRGRTILSTFTEKKKAQILARNMARQHASLSKYRELCSTLQPYAKCTPIYKRSQFENYRPHPVFLSSLNIHCPF